MKSFTLIETIVTITIFSLIMGVISGVVVMLYRTQSYTWQQSRAIGEARKGIEIMIKEIRKARYGDDGSYPIELADDDKFVFFSDIDKDEVTEWVRYSIDKENNIFKKEVVDPEGDPIRYPDPETEPEKVEIYNISRYVQNDLVFTYYNGNHELLELHPARLKDTKLMHLFLEINVNPDRSPQPFILESNVQIRNLKTNL